MQSVHEAPGERDTDARPPLRKCPECGITSEEKVLVMPQRLPYKQAKAYKGEMYCLAHAPRFDGSHLDLVGKLTTDRFGGDAA